MTRRNTLLSVSVSDLIIEFRPIWIRLSYLATEVDANHNHVIPLGRKEDDQQEKEDMGAQIASLMKLVTGLQKRVDNRGSPSQQRLTN